MHKTEYKGRKNLVGLLIKKYREQHKISVRQLSNRLIGNGLNWDKNAVNRAELGCRVISDIEFILLLKILEFSFIEIEVLL